MARRPGQRPLLALAGSVAVATLLVAASSTSSAAATPSPATPSPSAPSPSAPSPSASSSTPSHTPSPLSPGPSAAPVGTPLDGTKAAVLFRLGAAQIKEASGILVSPDGREYLMQQDSGNTSEVFVVDGSGQVASVIEVGSPNEDWEDLEWMTDTTGHRRVVIGDTGDAFFTRQASGQPQRTQYALVSIAQPVLGQNMPAKQTARDVIRYPFTFSDGKTHNVESLLIRPGSGIPYLVDKTEHPGQVARLWAGPATWDSTKTAVFKPVATVPITYATAGTFSPDGRFMVIRNADTAYIWRVDGGDVAAEVAKAPSFVTLPTQQQGEGIAYTPDGSALMINSEGRGTAVWKITLPAAFLAPATGTNDPGGRGGTSASWRLLPIAALATGLVLILALVVAAVRRRRQEY